VQGPRELMGEMVLGMLLWWVVWWWVVRKVGVVKLCSVVKEGEWALTVLGAEVWGRKVWGRKKVGIQWAVVVVVGTGMVGVPNVERAAPRILQESEAPEIRCRP